MNAYPAPQTTAVSHNYTSYPLKLSDDNRGDVRIDHQITASQSVFGRYSIDDTQIDVPNTYNGVIGGSENSFSGHQADRGQQGVLAYNKVITPSIVGEYRFGFDRYTSFLFAPVLSSPIFSEIAGGGPNPAINRGCRRPGATRLRLSVHPDLEVGNPRRATDPP